MTTPRPPPRSQHWPLAAPNRPSPSRTSSSRSSSKRSVSSVSRNSSPTKQLRLAELDKNGYTRRAFPLDTSGLPTSLQALLERLEEIDSGETRLPYEWWDQSLKQADQESQSRSRPDVPLAAFITRVIQRAIECDENNELECVWSDQVYRQILSWVLRPKDDLSGLVDFHACTSSRINRAFSPSTLPPKMVDYCLVLKSGAGSDISRQIDMLRASRPGISINHTDSGALCKYPIGLSLEFKSPEGSTTEAEVQMGTWHAAQLRSLLHQCPDASFQAIEFLPGIIVHGHEWYFVATVPPRPSTSRDPFLVGVNTPTLYSRISLGSTSKARGVCKIISSLRCLVTWLEEEYWSAFQKQVLQHQTP
ncbi:uncharacterized protein B0I36DRAFT_252499 [Microdochium trichocladiopsis]|uniref:PD-(D/E)XK nuclease-like domain-containing protein n=1 Tax=Microdochium trichocladiopsis TaxID=1682393 RepID=A0A9P8XZU6_9PEZI|nr:uncharacterized protein B0I36DRAFT_257513 [Microdochium trichocladiopsis]XP_046007809.1 uncharacterized protein B0I36DRAFT_252499 [Microdochium trichocladiopsis]KAH7010591.1 hypothetical protein B0I36DRAFT_257513 [Microdochium trichocladiopsis]KAH7021608.1 hypothetical protein B0I36DRAFT_252499 [Microdochium trichocladiopsis]